MSEPSAEVIETVLHYTRHRATCAAETTPFGVIEVCDCGLDKAWNAARAALNAAGAAGVRDSSVGPAKDVTFGNTTTGGAVTFEDELRALINRESKENGSDTPDFILAEYLIDCLRTWDQATRARDQWYDNEKHRMRIASGGGVAS